MAEESTQEQVADEAQAAMDALEAENRALLQEIAPRMQANGIHPVAFIKQVQIDLFFDFVYPKGSPVRGLFDAVFETVLNAKLLELKADLLRSDLTKGVTH
jgi:hypothetical protein